MPVDLQLDRSTTEHLWNSLGKDSGTAAMSFILHYSDNTIKIDGVKYGPDGDFRFVMPERKLVTALRAAVQNTWLDSRTDSLEEPVSALIHLSGDDSAVVSYHLGDDAADWVVADANATELFTSLASG